MIANSDSSESTTPAVTTFTRRTFLKTSALTVGAVAVLSQGRALAQQEESNISSSSQTFYALKCLADPLDNDQEIEWSPPYDFGRAGTADESKQIYYINSRTRVVFSIWGAMTGPQNGDKASKFIYTPTQAYMSVSVQRVSNETWDLADPGDWQWQTIVPVSGGFITYQPDLAVDQVEAWRAVDKNSGSQSHKDGQLRKKSFSRVYNLNYSGEFDDKQNGVNINLVCTLFVGAKPDLGLLGVSDISIKRNGVTSVSGSIGLLDGSLGVGWSVGTIDLPQPAIENLKFLWQSQIIQTNTIPNLKSP